MPEDFSDLKLPPPPELFPDKLKNIDPAGCEAKQEEFEQWWRKVTNKLRE